MREVICGIYYIYNNATDTYYIGQSVDIYKRFSRHNIISKNPDIYTHVCHNVTMYQDFHNNIDNLDFGIIERCNKESLTDRETYWIKYYHDNGYNLYNISDNGQDILQGLSKAVYQYDLDGNYIAEYKNSKQALLSLGEKINSGAIHNAVDESGRTAFGFQWRYTKFDKIDSVKIQRDKQKENDILNGMRKAYKVAKYNLQGDLLDVFENATLAAQDIGCSKNNITMCCTGDIQTCKHIYVYRYYDIDPEKHIIVPENAGKHKSSYKNARKVVQKYEDGAIEIYNSVKEICDKYDVDQSYMYKCCNHRMNTSGAPCRFMNCDWYWYNDYYAK